MDLYHLSTFSDILSGWSSTWSKRSWPEIFHRNTFWLRFHSYANTEQTESLRQLSTFKGFLHFLNASTVASPQGDQVLGLTQSSWSGVSCCSRTFELKDTPADTSELLLKATLCIHGNVLLAVIQLCICVCVCACVRVCVCVCLIFLTLADVSYHPTKPFSWQNCSIFIPLLVSTSRPWSHLLAKSTVATCFPLASVSLESKSSFHLVTASKEAGLVTSNTMNAPMASR